MDLFILLPFETDTTSTAATTTATAVATAPMNWRDFGSELAFEVHIMKEEIDLCSDDCLDCQCGTAPTAAAATDTVTADSAAVHLDRGDCSHQRPKEIGVEWLMPTSLLAYLLTCMNL